MKKKKQDDLINGLPFRYWKPEELIAHIRYLENRYSEILDVLQTIREHEARKLTPRIKVIRRIKR